MHVRFLHDRKNQQAIRYQNISQIQSVTADAQLREKTPIEWADLKIKERLLNENKSIKPRQPISLANNT